MRSKGLLVWNTLSQLTGAYVVFVDAVALERIGWKYYIVYMPLIIIQWLLLYRCEWDVCQNDWNHTDMYTDMVETKGYTLEEVAFAFDGSTAHLVDVEQFNHTHERSESDSYKAREVEEHK